MTFRKIFRYKFRYQLRYVSTWLLFAFFLLFGFIVLRIVTLADGAYLNAPGTIAFFTVFGSAIWVVIGGVVAGDAATRDLQTQKFTNNGYRIFSILAITLAVLSLFSPFSVPVNVTLGYSLVLCVMHLVVALVLVYFIGQALKQKQLA